MLMVAVKVTAWFRVEGERLELTDTEVLALFTTCVTVLDVLTTKF
jgi:hypothetical protein